MDIKNVENPVEFQLPTGNLVFIFLCAKKPGNAATPTLFGDLDLDLRNCPAISESSMSYPNNAPPV
jgi:hypothetical protein